MAKRIPVFATGFLLHDVSRIRKNVVDKKLKPLGITRSQWWALVNIARYSQEEGIAQTDLAKNMDMGKVSLGKLLDRMESSGWLIREVDPLDRRSKKVLISPAGEKVLDQIREIAVEVNQKIMKGISKDKNELLDVMLKTMKRNLLDMSDDI